MVSEIIIPFGFYAVFLNISIWLSSKIMPSFSFAANRKRSTKIKRTPPKENGNQQSRNCIKITVLRQKIPQCLLEHWGYLFLYRPKSHILSHGDLEVRIGCCSSANPSASVVLLLYVGGKSSGFTWIFRYFSRKVRNSKIFLSSAVKFWM